MNKVKRKWRISPLKILLYASLLFLAIYLYSHGDFEVPELLHPVSMGISLILLFGGFLIDPLLWKVTIRDKYPITYKDALISSGLYIFTKYIPGKVLIIVGRAGYINKSYGYPAKALIGRSLEGQLIAIFAGILTGAIALFQVELSMGQTAIVLIGISLLSLVLFTSFFQKIGEGILSKILKKEIRIPQLSLSKIVRILPVYFLYWVILSLAFYFFSASFTHALPSVSAGFVFPMGVTFGILAIIVPGGLGVREGVLAGFLHLIGFDLTLATSIALLSRGWYIIGELFLFIASIVTNSISKNNRVNNISLDTNDHAE